MIAGSLLTNTTPVRTAVLATLAGPAATAGDPAIGAAWLALRQITDQEEAARLHRRAYLLAVTGPATQRAALTELAKRQAVQAAAAWSVAATQLDQVNIDAGQGHQHVYLDTGPGGGALTPDGAAEGSRG